MERKKIVSLFVSQISYQAVIDQIIALATARIPSYVCFANAHMVIEAYQNADFALMVNQANIVAPDGMPLVKADRLLYGIKQERVAGMDIMESIVPVCADRGLSLFLFGSSPANLQAIGRRIKDEYPSLRIAGTLSPDFDAFAEADNQKYIDIINTSAAQVVLVALGCPKQEKWMAKNFQSIHAVLLGVGGAFAVYGGLKKRAPLWMQKWALEWFYRLMQEPSRMFKRYVVTNTLFLGLIAAQWFRLKVLRSEAEE